LVYSFFTEQPAAEKSQEGGETTLLDAVDRIIQKFMEYDQT